LIGIEPIATQFEPGAQAEKGHIPLCAPEIRGNELKYIKECLDTGWVSSVGSFVDRFEKKLASYVGAKHAVALVNGTAALHIALLVAGIRPDDEVLVSTLSFVAPANAIRYVGAWPVFIDAEQSTWQIDPQKVKDFVEKECVWRKGELRNRSTKRRVKAVLPVHILGHPVDMDPILKIAREYELLVIEDGCEGLGAKYRGRMVGHLGDIGCFSFNGNKIISAGGGGMIVTDNEKWARRAKYLSTQAKDDPVEYIHNEIGYNYRLTNIQAAVGCAQLELIEEYIAAKRLIASTYDQGLESIPGVTRMTEANWAYSIYWLYTILINPKGYEKGSRKLITELQEYGIQSRPFWTPCHRQKIFKGCQFYHGDNSDRLYAQGISLPSSSNLTPQAQYRVIETIGRSLQ
jgi:perosamine synthetase